MTDVDPSMQKAAFNSKKAPGDAIRYSWSTNDKDTVPENRFQEAPVRLATPEEAKMFALHVQRLAEKQKKKKVLLDRCYEIKWQCHQSLDEAKLVPSSNIYKSVRLLAPSHKLTEQLYDDTWRYLEQLSAGQFADVYVVQKVRSHLEEIRVMKKYREDSSRFAQRETMALTWLWRDNNAAQQLFAAFQYSTLPNGPSLIFNYDGPSIKDYIHMQLNTPHCSVGFYATELMSIMYDLCYALAYMHQKKLVHADIRPSNILLTDFYVENGLPYLNEGRIRLIDFNLTALHPFDCEQRIQTRLYRAPEVTMELSWSFPADIWSLGMLLLHFASYADFAQLQPRQDDYMWNLVMLERFNGPIPQKMNTQCEPEFIEKLTAYKSELLESETTAIAEVKTLKEVRKSAAGIKAHAMSLISEMIHFDPDLRIDAESALAHVYFRNVSRRYTKFPVQSAKFCPPLK